MVDLLNIILKAIDAGLRINSRTEEVLSTFDQSSRLQVAQRLEERGRLLDAAEQYHSLEAVTAGKESEEYCARAFALAERHCQESLQSGDPSKVKNGPYIAVSYLRHYASRIKDSNPLRYKEIMLYAAKACKPRDDNASHKVAVEIYTELGEFREAAQVWIENYDRDEYLTHYCVEPLLSAVELLRKGKLDREADQLQQKIYSAIKEEIKPSESSLDHHSQLLEDSEALKDLAEEEEMSPESAHNGALFQVGGTFHELYQCYEAAARVSPPEEKDGWERKKEQIYQKVLTWLENPPKEAGSWVPVIASIVRKREPYRALEIYHQIKEYDALGGLAEELLKTAGTPEEKEMLQEKLAIATIHGGIWSRDVSLEGLEAALRDFELDTLEP